MWLDLQKPDIKMHFGNPDFCISMLYVPKALLCSNIYAVFQIVFKFTRLDSKRSNTLALYGFLWLLKLHVFNYKIVTYGYLKYTALGQRPFNSAWNGDLNNTQFYSQI